MLFPCLIDWTYRKTVSRWRRVCTRECLGQGQQENVGLKEQAGWLRCPQLQPIGSPERHHLCPAANPRLPCVAGILLEESYLAKCSEANDGQGPGDGSEMWSLRAEHFRVETFLLITNKRGACKANIPNLLQFHLTFHIWYLPRCQIYAQPYRAPACSVLMGAVLSLGRAKVNYCTGRAFGCTVLLLKHTWASNSY